MLALILVSVGKFASAYSGDGRLFSVILNGNLTTSSQIFLNPDAADPVARSDAFAVTGSFGIGAELRYHLPETSISLGVSFDYIRASGNGTLPGTDVSVRDGYTVIPVELTGYFIIPFSGDTWGIFMGGGGGAYFGRRTYQLGSAQAALVDRTPGYGIHVLGGVSYRLFDFLEAVLEMKFRDLQFQSINTFQGGTVRFNDEVVNVSNDPFRSRIETDGVVFQLGLAFRM